MVICNSKFFRQSADSEKNLVRLEIAHIFICNVSGYGEFILAHFSADHDHPDIFIH